MKIEKVIVSTNSTSLYFDFWDIFSYVWKEKMGIDPVLIYIDKNPHDAYINEQWGQVIRIAAIDGVPEYIQTQWARFFFSHLFPNNVCMTSDIDMFPLSREYFLENTRHINLDDSSHVHLNANGVTGKFDSWLRGDCNLTVCYHVNYGKQFIPLFDMADTWEIEIRRLHSLNLGCDQSQWSKHLKEMPNWGAEEEYTTQVLRKKVNSGSVKLHTNGLYGHRFDRSNWENCKTAMNLSLFIDCHSLRPFYTNKVEILKILTHYHGNIDDNI